MIMDQESRDANSLLVELDRGLQSQNIGEQSEAVARFTSLFQRYPLPILINSACLKLSEAFRCGSNFIRVQICEVIGRNQCHLNKIYNVDVFYRNIFTVTTTNDPIARSIALLTLGNIAPIVSEHKTIHHCISSSLDSSIECELNASTACAACYVKHSSEFACNIYPKIVSIVDSKQTTNYIKIRALSVLDHGFYNANDAMTVRSFLIDVIEKSNLIRLICTCLTLSTKIAYTSLTHIRPQIELLLKMFLNENHLGVKLNALNNLRFLAEKSPHIWESPHVEPLTSYLQQSLSNDDFGENDRCLYIILSIFCKLLTCKCNFISQEEKFRVFQQSYLLALREKVLPLRSVAFELLTVISEEYSSLSSEIMVERQASALTKDIYSAIETFIVNSASDKESQKPIQQASTKLVWTTKPIYRHIVKLCRLNPHFCQGLLDTIFEKISDKDVPLSELCPQMTELMCAILRSTPESKLTPKNCWKLIETRASEMSETNLLNLCVLYFQTLKLRQSTDIACDLVDRVTKDRSLWFGFKVMRQAMRYGHYRVAILICNRLHEHVTTDTTNFYFKSLNGICMAEFSLLQEGDLDANLKLALPLYEEAISPLRASICNSWTTDFQLQFLWLRTKNLQAHGSLRQCCRIYAASPLTYATLLSAIGATRGGNDAAISKLGIIQQMPKIAKEFRHLSECYNNLSQVSFNCDDVTLSYVHLLRCSCVIMADAIDAIFQYGKNLPVISKMFLGTEEVELALEHSDLRDTCCKLIELIKTEIIKPGLSPSSETIEPLISLLKSFSNEILRCPFVYPRYFFQPLQMTQIKLAITPQPSGPSSSISLMLNYNLVLKVEGLIQNLSKNRVVLREVSKVLISVSMSSSKLTEQSPNLFIQSTATPSNNYFKTEFLLPLKWAGSFNVDIDVSIIDKKERIWKSGPSERLNLTVS